LPVTEASTQLGISHQVECRVNESLLIENGLKDSLLNGYLQVPAEDAYALQIVFRSL